MEISFSLFSPNLTEKYELAKNKMFSEQFFELLLDFVDNWKVERVYANRRIKEVDGLVSTKNQPKTAELLCYGFNVINRIMLFQEFSVSSRLNFKRKNT